jgi:hypothetical protein
MNPDSHTAKTKRVAAKSIAAIPAESIPFIGVADQVPEDVMHSVCDPELPDAGDVWGEVVENIDQWWESLVGAV